MIIRCREFVYVSNYRLKIPIVNHLFSDRTDGTDRTDGRLFRWQCISVLSRKSRNENLFYRWCTLFYRWCTGTIGTVGTDGQGFRGLPHALAITLTKDFTKGFCTFTDGVFISRSLRTDTKRRDNFTKVTVGTLATVFDNNPQILAICPPDLPYTHQNSLVLSLPLFLQQLS